MSLVYKCDGCSTAISQDELQRGEALAHQGQHYCTRCKVPILAFLRNAAAGGPPAANIPGGAVAPPPPASPPGEEVEADPLEHLEGLPSASPRPEGAVPAAASPPPAQTRPAAPGPAIPPRKAPLPPAARPAVPGARPPAPGKVVLHPGAAAPGRPPGKPPGAAPGAVPGQRAALRPGTPGKAPTGKVPAGNQPAGGARGAPLTGSPNLRKAGAAPGGLGLRGAAGKAPPGAAGGMLKAAGRRPSRFAGRRPAAAEAGAEPRSRRLPPPPILAAIAGGAVLILGLLGGAIHHFSRDRNPPAAAPAAVSSPGSTTGAGGAASASPGSAPVSPAAAEEAEVEKQRQYIATLRGRLSSEPEKILELERDLLAMGRPREPVAEEYQLLARELEGRRITIARGLLDETRSRSEALQKDLQFVQAHELWKTIPRLVEQNSDLYRQWVEEEQKASKDAEAAKTWAHLVEKAIRYVAQGDRDIALAIIEENIPSKYQHEHPILWEDCQKLLNKIRTEGAEAIAQASAIERKAREAREAELRAQREKEREERWNHALELIEWMPLLSLGGDLENWYKTVEFNPMDLGADPFPWKNTREGDHQVLSADNSGRDGEIMIGMNGDRWQDWALEFEVQVLEGSLRLETRTVLGGPSIFGMGGRGGMKAPEDFLFESKDYGAWTPVRLEVRARKVRWIEGGALKKEVEMEHENGGFRFFLQPKSMCKMRDIRIKLVSVLKPGEEPGASGFGEEEEE